MIMQEDTYMTMRLQNNKIEILIDLLGLFHADRIGIFNSRISPLQISWLGYPNTTGIDNIDYRIVDIYTDLAENDKFNIEKLYKLETPFLCFEFINTL